MQRYFVIATCSASALAISTAAMAAQANEPAAEVVELAAAGSQLEEIIVTARKREESLQSVPVAVSVVGGELLKNSLASDLTKMAELAPQLSVGQGGQASGSVITIRGVSTSTTDSGLDQSVAIEIDGVPLSRGQIGWGALFDIESVQVLEGPQALFFGKNSPAGVISIRSADPTGHLEGYVNAGYEFVANERFIEGAISGPLTSTLKARFAFRGAKMEGWMKNVAGPLPDIFNPAVTIPAPSSRRGPNSENLSARLTLHWEPTDSFEAKFKLTASKHEQNGGTAGTESYCINGQVTPVIIGAVPTPGDCRKDRVKSEGDIPAEYLVNIPELKGAKPYLDTSYILSSLSLNKDFGPVSLSSVTGYYKQDVNNFINSDFSPYASIWTRTLENYEIITQEVRADTDLGGSVNFMFGAYYEHSSRRFNNAVDIVHVFNPIAQNYATVVMNSNTIGNYLSAFAQARWDILPDLELSGGARFSKDRKRISINNLQVGPLFPNLLPVGATLKSKYSDNNISPEVTVKWMVQPDQTLYAAFKSGYKGGGLSNAFLVYNTVQPADIRFRPETTEGFEAGYKARFFNRRLRLDLVGYRYTYQDLQVVSVDNQTINFVLKNAASARIKGVQASAEWLVLENFSLRGNMGLNSAKYLSFPNAPCFSGQTAAEGCLAGGQDLSGKRLTRAPKLTFSLGGDYTTKVAKGWKASFSLSAARTSSYQAASDYAPGGVQKAYWVLNSSVRIEPEDERFELALIGRNLTNSYYMLESIGHVNSGDNDQYVGYFNRPREIVVRTSMRF